MKLPKNQTLVLSKMDVISILNHFGIDFVMDELISRMTKSIKEYNPEKTTIPTRSGFHYEEPRTGLIEWMPIHQHGEQVVIKIVGYHPMNPNAINLPTIISTISSYDTTSGHLKSVMDGVLLTALRTGAASAVATKLLAHEDSTRLGLVGCGAQAVTQLHALSRVFDLKEVFIYDTDLGTMQSFEGRIASQNLDLEITFSTIEEIISTSDIVCTATSIDVGSEPLFNNLETKPHLHINAVGSDFPGKTELPMDFLKNSFVCPDFLSQAIVEGECQKLSEEDIAVDWVEILQNTSKYEYVKNQKSVFDSTGWALEDQVVADLFSEYADKLGLGQQIQIESMPIDAKNPYEFTKVSKASLIA